MHVKPHKYIVEGMVGTCLGGECAERLSGASFSCESCRMGMVVAGVTASPSEDTAMVTKVCHYFMHQRTSP